MSIYIYIYALELNVCEKQYILFGETKPCKARFEMRKVLIFLNHMKKIFLIMIPLLIFSCKKEVLQETTKLKNSNANIPIQIPF